MMNSPRPLCWICGNPTPGLSHKCTDYLKAKILTLKADLATMGQKFTQYYDAFSKVKDDFNKFGGHWASCGSMKIGNTEWDGKCDCGFAESLGRWG